MLLKVLRFWLILLGGMLLGAGLVLHGQVAIAQEMRHQVQDTFFLWRAIGQVTFIFQDDVTKAALWMNEVPESVLRESDRAAWVLAIIGALMALAAPLCRRRRKRKR